MSATQTLATRERADAVVSHAPDGAVAVRDNDNTSVSEFMSRIKAVVDEFDKTKPKQSRWRGWASFARWQEERQRKFAEIMHDFKIGANGSNASSLATLEQTAECLVQSTCIAERDAKRREKEALKRAKRREKEALKRAKRTVKFNFKKIRGWDGNSRLSFIEQISGGGSGFRTTLCIEELDTIKIYFDVSADEPMWFLGETKSDNTHWLSRAELHVHSEDDVKFLLEE